MKLTKKKTLAVRDEITLYDDNGQVLIRVSGPYAEQAIALFAHAIANS